MRRKVKKEKMTAAAPAIGCLLLLLDFVTAMHSKYVFFFLLFFFLLARSKDKGSLVANLVISGAQDKQ